MIIQNPAIVGGGNPIRPMVVQARDECMEECKECGVGHSEEVEGEEVEHGKRDIKKMNDPRKPSEADVIEHNMTHLPYRSWCRHCVRGRGEELPHLSGGDAPIIPEVHMDFCFMGDESGGETMVILVARERSSRMMLASAVPSKSTGNFIARRIVAFMREIGCEQGDVTVRTDQEPAIKAIVTEVGKVRAAAGGGKMMVEASPVKQSQSNGLVERAIKSEEAMTRVMRSALEERWGVKLAAMHPVFAWMAEYAAVLLNRFEVGRDGKTAFERCKGKKAKVRGVEFGEAVLWKIGKSFGRSAR